MSGDAFIPSPDGALRPDCHQNVEPQHRRRQNQWQGHDRLREKFLRGSAADGPYWETTADLASYDFTYGERIGWKWDQVLRELQLIADSSDPIRRTRGRRGLEMLTRLQRSQHFEVKIHEGDIPEETTVDGKLVGLARRLNAKLFTNDYNLSKVAELHSVPYVNLNELSQALKPVILPGEILNLRVVREGKDKGQGVGYLPDGTMVVINQASHLVGNQVEVQVLSLLQTGAGVIIFADLAKQAAA